MLASTLSKYKSGLSLAFVLIFSLSNMIWQSNVIARSANRAVEVLDFFTETFHALGNGISQLFDSYGSFQEMKRERDLYREKLKNSRDIQIQLIQLKRENERLRELLSLPAPVDYPVIQAEVISQDPDNWFRTIIINKGEQDGVKPYMPVIAIQTSKEFNPDTGKTEDKLNRGVVGKVIQVNRNSARILPISDQYSRVGIQVKKTGHWALLTGRNPHSENPLLEYLSLGVFLKPGDEIVTSGGDGVFPRNLPVGYVSDKIERLGSFQQAEVKPFVDFKKLDFVIIIKKERKEHLRQFEPLSDETVAGP